MLRGTAIEVRSAWSVRTGFVGLCTFKAGERRRASIKAGGIQADRSISLVDDFSATGVGPEGAVRLSHAHIGGHLHCTAVSLHNDSGPALSAQRLRVDNDVFLSGTFIGKDEFGAARFVGAQLGGLLEIDGASIRNDSGPALMAERLQVADNMFLRGDFTAEGNRAAVTLNRAHLGGDLKLPASHAHQREWVGVRR